MNINSKVNQGQAMVALLFVVAIVLFWVVQTVVSGLGTVSVGNEMVYGWQLLTKTEGYLENAAIRYIRNPIEYQGESLQEGDYSCTIQVSDVFEGKELLSTCQRDGRFKTVSLTVNLAGGLYRFSKITER